MQEQNVELNFMSGIITKVYAAAYQVGAQVENIKSDKQQRVTAFVYVVAIHFILINKVIISLSILSELNRIQATSGIYQDSKQHIYFFRAQSVLTAGLPIVHSFTKIAYKRSSCLAMFFFSHPFTCFV